LVAQLREVIEAWGRESHPTFFEVVAVMAAQYFAEQKCDLVIWETGLGGRLDATNIVTPLASVITNIQLDHQKWLGDTIREIAAEKAGIIKPGVPVVTTAKNPDALRVIVETAQRVHAPLTVVEKADENVELTLAGEHQKTNAALAAAVARVLYSQLPMTESIIREGLKTAHWAGRQQLVERGGQIILLDGAHNPAGAQTLAAALQTRFAGRSPVLILGAMRDKDCSGICEILAPLAKEILIAQISSDRGADPKSLAELCREFNSAAQIGVCSGIGDALAKIAREPFVVVTGSIHLIGDAMVALGMVAASDESSLNEYTTDFAGVRAVTFDVGGTLIEPWPSVGDVYAQIAKRHGIHVSPDKLNNQFAAAWKAKKSFGYSMAEWTDLIVQSFAGLSGKPSAALCDDLYQHFATAAPWRVFDDVRPCLERLRKRGLKLGVISNWDERLRSLLHALELDKYFDSITVSTEIGHHKPDREIFDAAAAQIGESPEAILHIGDSALEDFEGARAASYRALLLRRNGAKDGNKITSLDRLLL
jgi:dihydrofolate synthase/folylpolyglutamate synthase